MQMITYTPQTRVLVNFLRQEPRIVGLTYDEGGDDEAPGVVLWAMASIPDFEGNNAAPGLVFFKGKTECMAINKVKAFRQQLVSPDAADLDHFEEVTEVDCYTWFDPEDERLLQAA